MDVNTVFVTSALGGLVALIGVLLMFILAGFRSEMRSLRSEMGKGFAEAKADREKGFAEAKAEYTAGFAEAKADRAEMRAEYTAGFAEAKADREKGFAEARDDRAALRADYTNGLAEARDDRAALRADVGEIKESVARIEATQQAHGQHLERMADQGERIAALEGARVARAS